MKGTSVSTLPSLGLHHVNTQWLKQWTNQLSLTPRTFFWPRAMVTAGSIYCTTFQNHHSLMSILFFEILSTYISIQMFQAHLCYHYLPNILFSLSWPGPLTPTPQTISWDPFYLPHISEYSSSQSWSQKGYQQNLRGKNLSPSPASWHLKLYRAVKVNQDGPTEGSLAKSSKEFTEIENYLLPRKRVVWAKIRAQNTNIRVHRGRAFSGRENS